MRRIARISTSVPRQGPLGRPEDPQVLPRHRQVPAHLQLRQHVRVLPGNLLFLWNCPLNADSIGAVCAPPGV
eukprot:4391792-Pyramimonas_sp.AAC.1